MGATLLGRGVGRNTLCCALPEVTRDLLEAGLEVTNGPLELETALDVTKGPLEAARDVTKGPLEAALEARNPGGGVTVTV